MRNIAAIRCFFACAMAASAATPTIDQSFSMKSASGAQISPDGRYVAYRSAAGQLG